MRKGSVKIWSFVDVAMITSVDPNCGQKVESIPIIRINVFYLGVSSPSPIPYSILTMLYLINLVPTNSPNFPPEDPTSLFTRTLPTSSSSLEKENNNYMKI